MPSVNAAIQDATIAHQVDLLRVEAGLKRDILALMQELSGDLSATLAKAGDWEGDNIPRKLKRLDGLKKQTDGLIDDLYWNLETETVTEMKDAGKYAAEWVPQTINTAVGVNIAEVKLTTEVLNNLVKNTLVDGAPSRDWWAKQASDLKLDFMREMRMGILQGESLGDLTRRIRGRRENGYADGLLPPLVDEATGRVIRATQRPATRNAQALALTSVQQVMADARMEAYRQNADILSGVQQLSTLDSRTSPTCRGYDHAARTLDGGPIKGYKLLPPGGPPWHWRCRSVLMPIVKGYDDLKGKAKSKIPSGTRASMDGQVPDSLDYETWLKSKPEAFQREVLGPARYQLWKDGKASLYDMVDQQGRAVRVRELAPPAAPPEPPKPKFQAQKDLAAAAKYAVDQNLADKASYKGAHIDVANAWNKSIFEHLQEFPELRPNFKFIGTTQEAQRHYVDEYIKRWRPLWESSDGSISDSRLEALTKQARRAAGKTPGQVWAYAYRDEYRQGIAVNSKWAGEPAKLNQSLDRNVRTGYHPPGCDTVKSIVDHEIAHQLDNLLGISNNTKLAAIKAKYLANGEKIESLVSVYATKNDHELIAEAWAEYRNNPTPRKMASDIARLILDEYSLLTGGPNP